MAVTFITGQNRPISAYDVDGTQLTYSVQVQPGSDITGFANTGTNITLTAGTPITGVAKPVAVYVLQSASSGNAVIKDISLVETDANPQVELLTDNGLDDVANEWVINAGVTDNADGTVTMTGTTVSAEIKQDVALTANREYTMTVVADIPINTTVRLQSYHYDTTGQGAGGTFNQTGFIQDIPGAGAGEETYTFKFFPAETTRIDPASTVNRALNGGPGSVDYGTNNTSSKTYRHRNTTDAVEHNMTIRATDSDGETADRSFKVRASLPWRYIANISHNFIAGGYYNAESWRTTNRCDVSTDTTSNLGALLAANGVTSPNANRSGMRYSDSSNDRWTGNAICYSTFAYDASLNCENFNMITSTMYGNGARLANSTNGGNAWTDDTRRTGFYGGPSGIYEKFTHTTMTRITQFTGFNSYNYHATFFNQTDGFTYSATAGNQSTAEAHSFSTDTRRTGAYSVNGTFAGGTGNHTKAISTIGYGQDEIWLVGWNIVSSTCIVRLANSTAVAGPNQTINNGEGNCTSGPVDSHGYSLGGYNGSPQNNHADRMNYASSTITRVASADLRPHTGASSGGRMWAEL